MPALSMVVFVIKAFSTIYGALVANKTSFRSFYVCMTYDMNMYLGFVLPAVEQTILTQTITLDCQCSQSMAIMMIHRQAIIYPQ